MQQRLFSLHVSLLKAAAICLGSSSSRWRALMVCKDVLLAAACLSEAVARAAGREQAWLWLYLVGRV
jgi:hypothetical protein